MGYHRHHAIIVTSSHEPTIEAAHAKAQDCFRDTGAAVTDPTPATTNGYRSFMVAPDGSKEGWDESDRADAARAEFPGLPRHPGPAR